MDITKSDRVARGTMVIERITTKRKLEMSWNYLSQANLTSLIAALSTDIFFTVTYPDPLLGTNNTITCYVGDRTVGMMKYQDGVPIWKDFKANVIEQ